MTTSWVKCPYCNTTVSQMSLLDHVLWKHNFEYEVAWQEQYLRNLKIISEEEKKRKRRLSVREKAAIYRLYKGCNIGPYRIAKICGLHHQTVIDVVTAFFVGLCVSNDSCWAKPFLTKKEEPVSVEALK